ncbi:MAG: aminotransferase class IV [Planctomycetes bacterium]|nr:aminotransferase class IV [Planctomycetota bacterium]
MVGSRFRRIGPTAMLRRMPDVCSVDGRILPETDATIPVLDRGFLFADSVYEVLRTRGGVPFAWRAHLARLRASATGIALDRMPADADLLRAIAATLAAGRACGPPPPHGEYVRLIVTRGDTREIALDPAFAVGPPRVVVIARTLTEPRGGRPAKVALVPRRLDAGGDRRDPSIKSGSYLGNLLGLAEARRAGATDCVFVEADGQVSEASTANVFAVFGDRVVTPPLSTGLLAGVTRGLLFAAADRTGIPIEERPIRVAEFRAADEAFLTGTLRDLAPIVQVDGTPLGHPGRDGAGPVTLRLTAAWTDEVRRQSARDAADMATILGAD